jgi:UTP-glucose-1-phosphate uridylyltransferase
MSIYGPHLFDYIERARGSLKEGEEFTDVSVRSLILQEREMLGCRLPGTLFDIGNPDGYRQCLAHIGKSPP